jgi:menaquinone-dependent protoporphyrinogen IX oxidase
MGVAVMKTLVVYHSRSGTTRKVAAELARVLKADLEEIHAEKSYLGMFGYLRAGRDSLRGKLPEITPANHALAGYDLVVLAGPIWAGHASPVLRRYVRDHKAELKQIGVVLTHGGSSPKTAYAEIEGLAGRKAVAKTDILERSIRQNAFEMAVADFAGPIRFKEEAVF